MTPRILLTNDDGFDAPGLWALRQALKEKGWGECFISAPLTERSASGHGVTLHGSIRVEKRYEKGRLIGFAIDGTPADCVKFALSRYYGKTPPDLVISGVNPGPNTGVSIYYSGTIAAAREALFAHIPAFAVSVAGFIDSDFERFAKTTVDVVQKIYRALDSDQFFYNINIPVKPHPPRGVKITHHAHSRFKERFVPSVKRGAKKGAHRDYVLRGEILLLKETGMSDVEAVREGYISLTPCQLDVSAYSEIEKLEKVFGRSKRKRSTGRRQKPRKR